MTQDILGPTGLVRSVFWRKITPGDFFNIERTREAGPAGGGGQLYIDIPLGSNISIDEFGNFVRGQPLDNDDSTWPNIKVQAFSASTPVVVAPLPFTPRRGGNRRYRIANQNRQASGSHRHPAWSADRGFPEAPDDVTSSTDPRMPNLSYLKIFIARTDAGEFLAGYSNSVTMPPGWPRGIGLETLFEPNASVEADGIIQVAPDIRLSPARLSGLITTPFGDVATIAEELHKQARIVPRSAAPPQPVGGDTRAEREYVTPRLDTDEAVRTQAPRASEAEDWVENRVRQIYHGRCIRRIGHTPLELEVMDDGYLPGADIVVFDALGHDRERFIEVKSAVGTFPFSIRLTASELQRAKRCSEDGLPYDIWVIVFEDSPSATVIPNFEQNSVQLTIDDLVSLDIQVYRTQ